MCTLLGTRKSGERHLLSKKGIKRHKKTSEAIRKTLNELLEQLGNSSEDAVGALKKLNKALCTQFAHMNLV